MPSYLLRYLPRFTKASFRSESAIFILIFTNRILCVCVLPPYNKDPFMPDVGCYMAPFFLSHFVHFAQHLSSLEFCGGITIFITLLI